MARIPSRNAEALARLVTSGPDALDDAEALQVAVGLGAAETAALFAEFGSLPEVLAATPAALARRVPAQQAARIALLKDVARRLLAAPLRARPALSGWDAVADYLRTVLAGRGREQLRGLFLDRRNRLIRDEVLGEGTVDHVPVYPREIVRRALELDASAVVLAHNHPGGLGAPSAADVESTRQVVEAGRLLRIAVHDHFLVADQTVVSFRSLGLL
ncbi:MAG: DNA repair protein RadC [Phenylobacterium sp.]|uniref:JAB domain-containing protein n=1 Tax=Phenylobacterium sp. TaxID=1871053 RepID=UPI001208E4B9|nr:DNA repair protein RadC [Phenylobacterium sp.]TAJ71810.1 MAG: DNA repair protein RadC [Phenylobacterium sp.]